MKTDIQNRKDVQKIVNNFYQKLLSNKEFEHLFIKVAEIDVLTHIDIIIDFWESVLFQVGKYKRDLIDKHLALNHLHRLNEKHFEEWLQLFNESVDELYEGEKAKKAKDQAFSLAKIIRLKIDDLEKKRLEFNN